MQLGRNRCWLISVGKEELDLAPYGIIAHTIILEVIAQD